MATNLTNLRFDDGADIHVIAVDGHNIAATALDFQEHGVIVEFAEGTATNRQFLPWHFIQSINQVLGA